jgi:hypothetical protein
MTFRVPDTVFRVPVQGAFVGAGIPVVLRSAGVRIGAAVLPGVALKLLWCVEYAVDQVNATPFQAERFTFAKSQGQGDGEPDTVSSAGCGRENSLSFLDGEGFDFLFLKVRGLGELSRVASQVTAPHRFVECGFRGAVDLVGGSGGASRANHPAIELLQVLGLEPIQPVRTDAWDEVFVYGGSISGNCCAAACRGCDGFHPVGQPLFEGPRPAGFAKIPATQFYIYVDMHLSYT